MQLKTTIILFSLSVSYVTIGQVGIGTNTPHASAALEVLTTNKGFLAPRVALTSNSDVATIASPATGLMIYNTATAGTSPNAVVPGYYYYSGSKWERLITTTPDATIEFNTANPNTGTPTFTPNTPSSADYIYVSSVDASQWFWNGSAYVTYVAPSSTPFYIGGTTNDAGNNKTAAIERTGSIQSSGGSIKSGKTNYIFEMNANNSSGPVLDLGTSLDAQAYWRIGAYGGINNFDTKTRDLNFFSSAKSNILYLKNNTGNVGVGTSSPASKLDVSAGVTTANSIVNATGSINDYLQFNIQNTSTGTQAQSGYSATANNGSATTGFAWLGINNSNFNFPTSYNIGGANDVSFIGSGQDLYVANASNTKSIIFSTGKATTPFFAEQMRILNNGNVGIGTSSPVTTLQINNPLTASASVNANAQVLRLSRPTTSGSKWDNIAQFNLGSYSTAIAANSRLDLALTNGGNATDLTNVMTWQANGNVGINNTAPSAPLVIQGVTGAGSLKLIAPSVASGDNWWLGFGHGSTSTDANDRARIGAEIIAGGAGRLFFTTGSSGAQTRAMFIDESQRVGIGTSSPAQKLEVNSGALATPPIRLTQQTATNAATVSSTVTSAHNLVVGDNGDVLTVPYRKEFSPNNCNCASVVPFTLPANFTYFGVTDGNYAGTSQSNTTAADYYLPTVANARAAGHSYGDVVVVYRGSGWNSVVGTTNTDLPANYLLAAGESLVFVLTPSKWKRVNTY